MKSFLASIAAVAVPVLICVAVTFMVFAFVNARTVTVPDEGEVVGTIDGNNLLRVVDDKYGVACYGMQRGSLSPAVSCVKIK